MSKSQIRTADDIKRLGTIMSIWAHPDDESFTAAGIMTTAIKNGQEVVCLTATKGEAGIQDESRWPPAELGEIRAKELESALKQIGIKHHFWLGYHDGQCQEVDTDEAVTKIKEFIEQFKPDTILTFGPDGITGHNDHRTVSKWVSEATKGSNITVYHTVEEEKHYNDYMVDADKKFNIYFNIDKPPVFKAEQCDIVYCLPKNVLDCKCNALKSMPSQTEAMFKTMSPEFMDAMLDTEYYVRAT